MNPCLGFCSFLLFFYLLSMRGALLSLHFISSNVISFLFSNYGHCLKSFLCFFLYNFKLWRTPLIFPMLILWSVYVIFFLLYSMHGVFFSLYCTYSSSVESFFTSFFFNFITLVQLAGGTRIRNRVMGWLPFMFFSRHIFLFHEWWQSEHSVHSCGTVCDNPRGQVWVMALRL